MTAFRACDVFKELYLDGCNHALASGALRQESDRNLLPVAELIHLVDTQFYSLSEELMEVPSQRSASIHRRVIESQMVYLESVQDPTLDLLCLYRIPEYRFPCGHCFCDVCVQIYNESCRDNPWEYNITRCMLCHRLFEQPVKIRLRNPARGLNVLSLDGGGCRGIVPLAFLRVLEGRIGLPYPIQENFDIVIGTSSGKSEYPVDDRTLI